VRRPLAAFTHCSAHPTADSASPQLSASSSAAKQRSGLWSSDGCVNPSNGTHAL